ncbi:phytanoyl-CoA dioxygenase family protein [Sandaracinobacter neustonicus]|uniref:Phytanoyl-CoA dioxygenase family protein n=1 Tax=Sandaracinobacter neustonicus TaxID=1715348 RepID=A0A501XVI7_9SPHN|nr:phytanoyl-CoA dioxygenase family protein [Sandaracinobacter neustonicus]TPE64601.1 phytanoyl-CoA dioxygenase family protein [Sandaracinobacter neustonicus]
MRLLKAVLNPSACDQLISLFSNLPQHDAGVRISGLEGLDAFVGRNGPIGSIAASHLGPECRAVRAVLFDKSAETNWALGWHQDRTICVRERRDVPGFGPWTIKSGLLHVAPPFALLAGMLTLRVHLDDVPSDNAPLLVAPGSHRYGRVPVADIEAVVRKCGVQACIAKAGDVWLYATPILHASEAAVSPARRRVLQLDYAAEKLPDGLEWAGI